MARDEESRDRRRVSYGSLAEKFARVHVERGHALVAARQYGFSGMDHGVDARLEGVDRHGRLADLY